MEFCQAGSVGYIMENHEITLNEGQIARILSGVLKGLECVHKHNIIHDSIMARNIYLTASGIPKLGIPRKYDFHTSSLTYDRPMHWLAPEFPMDDNPSVLGDMWSIGITAIEMAEGEPPNYHMNPMKVLFLLMRNPPPRLKHEELW
eukprot:CAMPEP_0168521952 /NCGR_PEP_ID=MMETSP0405-20121227/8988_1 /TAXON_ID=498012 /ORGANISM="Trichosphaerium sp, Strain Am-I-7 wt" /LENGTH=145 /DNA_ID=CAMNT_0008543321 /DNA_START=2325 /DNA_END=2759 /DNA_ORIENTATION=+